jgi:LPS-assembly lipoprotein
MSSFDRAARHWRGAARVVAFALAAGLVSACTIQPVYAPVAGAGSTAAALRGIAIDPVNDRVSQVVRNRLLFGLAGGTNNTQPVYQMHLVVTDSEAALGIGATGASPTNSVTVGVTYEVTRIGTKDVVVARNTVRASASYALVNQSFANTRAKIDAENRAATSAADEIRIRVAAALAKHT